MSDNPGEFITGSIDDYLLGLADGLQKAQRQLSQMALVVEQDQAPITYQIPRIEFELKMSLEVASASDTDPSARTVLRFRPASPSLAIPARGGKPPPVIRTRLRAINLRLFEVTVQVSSAAGERLAGVDVQFNVDRERSRQLRTVGDAQQPVGFFAPDDDSEAARASRYNSASFGDTVELSPGTGFWDGLVTTDASGSATGVLNIDSQEAPGARIVAVIDVLGQTETILFKVE